jgi:hypothetical protein
MIAQIINRRHLKKREMVWLEVTPPSSIHRTPESTEQLFAVIHGAYSTRRLIDKLLFRSPVMSFEITSTKNEGIRYLIQVERTHADLIHKAIAAYIAEAKVKEVRAPLLRFCRVYEFKETGHFVLPLCPMTTFSEHDPLAYVTNAMTKLNDDESVTLQLVISPIKIREASVLARKILSNEDVLSKISSGKFAWLQVISSFFNKLAFGLTDITSEVYNHSASSSYTINTNKQDISHQSQVARHERPARTLSSFEQELMLSMHRKVTQPLFRASLRIITSGLSADDHARAVRNALDGYSVPLYQSLKAKVDLPFFRNHRAKLAEMRLPAILCRSSMVLSATEIAGLYHFPSSRISRTDNLVASLSKTLPAPVSLKTGSSLAVVIGENYHHGVVTPIGLTEAERQRHVYIIGGTGNGKTTMLLYSIVQDIKNGNGVAVLDPHGDLAETILRYIPRERIDDVIYMNPDDLSYPIGMNLLELPEDIAGDDLLREKDIITESAISVLRKIFSEDDSGGHRIEYILRNAIQTALTLEKPTLFTIFRLLNDAKFRREVIKNLEDENLRNFWKNEIGKAGEMQRVKMAAGITAKIGRFLFSASARRVLEQEKSTIDFDKILDDGKIFICNFSKGLLGEDTSTLFGTTVLAKLQLASLRRARISASNRRPFYLYVDEFQNFATTSFTQMLSEARKYKLFLTMAEQSTSQQDQQRLVDVILANVGTVICFRSGSPADERLVLPLFRPFIEEGEIANLPVYSFYARISAVHSQEPMSGVTLLLEDDGDKNIAKQVVEESRKKYTKTVEEQKQNKPEPQSVERIDDKPKTQRRRRKTSQPRKTVSNAIKEVKPLG